MCHRRPAVDYPGMLTREAASTRASIERAWEQIADPTFHRFWIPRIVDTQVSSAGGACLGVVPPAVIWLLVQLGRPAGKTFMERFAE